MKVAISGTRDGVEWPARGEVVDLPEAEAAQYVAAGLAAEVEVGEVETATPGASAAETATPRARRAKAK